MDIFAAYERLASILSTSGASFGLLSQQASPLAEFLHTAAARQFKAIFSAEHGYFGDAAAGEKTGSIVHPQWKIPIHSLYGATREPTPEMFDGLDLIIADLQDLGVRCYTYLATIRNMIRAAATRGIPLIVVDHPIPLGGFIDGPMREPAFDSFVAPANIPLCHGMTFAEEAMFLAREIDGAEVTPVPIPGWSHDHRDPWPDFMPPSPGIKSWDSAVLYPFTVFTEAYPAVQTDRTGNLAFRVLNAPWMDAHRLHGELEEPLSERGITLREYRINGIPGLLFAISNPLSYHPVEAGLITLFALLKHYPTEMAQGMRPEWLAKLLGTDSFAKIKSASTLKRLFVQWAEDRDQFKPINLYP